jgi:hypothetical protein
MSYKMMTGTRVILHNNLENIPHDLDAVKLNKSMSLAAA